MSSFSLLSFRGDDYKGLGTSGLFIGKYFITCAVVGEQGNPTSLLPIRFLYQNIKRQHYPSFHSRLPRDVCRFGSDMTRACYFTVSKALGFRSLPARQSVNRSFSLSCKSNPRHIEMETSNSNQGSESRGAFIVVEGLDRSGKTSQCSRLLSHLVGSGHSAELWRFPDRNTSVGQMISSYLSNKSQLDDHTIHLLFSANRWEKRSLMETKLKAGTTLIVDRYSYSGVAFSSAKGLDFDWCKAPENGLLAPDMVVYLDISPEKAAERGGYGGERYEQLEFQKKVVQRYQLLSDPSWKMVDASLSVQEIEKQMQEMTLDCIRTCHNGKPLSCLWSD